MHHLTHFCQYSHRKCKNGFFLLRGGGALQREYVFNNKLRNANRSAYDLESDAGPSMLLREGEDILGDVSPSVGMPLLMYIYADTLYY